MHGEFANAYLFSGNMPSGTNAVVEVMHRYFMIVGWPMYAVRLLKVYSPPPLFFFIVISRTLLAYIEKNGKLPSTWFLQLDNTCK